jgi:hypothetical protein
MGNVSCGKYAAHRKSRDQILHQLYSQWAQGFITGWNIGVPLSGEDMGKQKLQVITPDEESIFLYLDNYCNKKPLGYIFEGVYDLIKELGAESRKK